MSKKIIDHVIHLFKTLACDDLSLISFMKLRKDEDYENQIQIFHKSKIVEQDTVLADVRYAVIERDNCKYFCLVNAASKITSDGLQTINEEGIIEVSIDAGLFILLVKGLKLNLRKGVSSDYLEQYILHQHEDPEYSGHSLDDVMSCFEELVVFKVESNSSFIDSDNFNIACMLYSCLDGVMMPEVAKFVFYYRHIFKRKNRIFSDNILLSMTASHWKHCFLEIYRCIEGIFPLPRARELMQSLEASLNTGVEKSSETTFNGMSLRDFAGSCYKILAWKSNEKDALKLLFNITGNAAMLRSELLSVSFISNSAYSIPLAKKQLHDISEKIYLLRNQLVHQFKSDEELFIKDDDWPKLVTFMLIFWDCCLDEFSSAF